jgi:hypothetical protein
MSWMPEVLLFWFPSLVCSLVLMVLSTVLYHDVVVESAVQTVMVCFCESAAEFQEHHPQLCDELKAAGWAEAYPAIWSEQTAIPVPASNIVIKCKVY